MTSDSSMVFASSDEYVVSFDHVLKAALEEGYFYTG